MKRVQLSLANVTVVQTACHDAEGPELAKPVDPSGVVLTRIMTVGVDIPVSFSIALDGGPARSVAVNDSTIRSDRLMRPRAQSR